MTQVPIAVLISGRGSNLQKLLEVSETRAVGYRVAVVIADRDAPGLAMAEGRGIPTHIERWANFSDRSDFTAAICDQIEAYDCAFVVLAGFMRVLAPVAIARFPRRILNIHPSLLPSFPGANAVENALEAGVAETGVTVHIVIKEVDAGPIVAQRTVPVLPGDDAASLHARIQEQEHVLYPEVVDALAKGQIDVADHEVVWA